ncbi:hypothetical protein QAD02_003565 [Eretmocerus hayati]|uniref:Uncharacterized protein n=1 Tax=Eretmocerus hayati TaxID=131215 RepID=A0ACC2NMG7_9HYME|nr:hypothetical protein QAD02_003565 [Eretmocerus hayati]
MPSIAGCFFSLIPHRRSHPRMPLSRLTWWPIRFHNRHSLCALLPHGMSKSFPRSNNSKNLGVHKGCPSVSSLLYNSSAELAPRDATRPVKGKNARLDQDQHNGTVKDRKAVNSRVVLLVDHLPRITSSRATPMAGGAADPISQ